MFLAVFSVPVILFYAFTALKKLPGANWPIPAYFTFSIIAAIFCFNLKSKVTKKIFIASICFNIVMSILVGLHAKYTIIPLDKFSNDVAIADATNYFHGYKELTEEILKNDIDFALTPSHQLAAIIAYYGKGKITTHAYSNGRKKSQFDVWKFPKPFNFKQPAFVYESEDGKPPYDVSMFFLNVSQDTIPQGTVRNNNIARKFFIQKVSGYKNF